MQTQVVAQGECNTVRDLLLALSRMATQGAGASVLDSTIEADGKVFNGFQVHEVTLSDGSKVLDFKLVEYLEVGR